MSGRREDRWKSLFISELGWAKSIGLSADGYRPGEWGPASLRYPWTRQSMAVDYIKELSAAAGDRAEAKQYLIDLGVSAGFFEQAPGNSVLVLTGDGAQKFWNSALQMARMIDSSVIAQAPPAGVPPSSLPPGVSPTTETPPAPPVLPVPAGGSGSSKPGIGTGILVTGIAALMMGLAAVASRRKRVAAV